MQAVDGVDFHLEPGEVLAIVGESGSGKSVTAQTIIGLTRSPNSHIEGSVRLRGEELTTLCESQLQKVRGSQIAMIFQDPMTSMNPVYTVGKQIVEAIRAHDAEIGKKEAHGRAIELLDSVGIPDAERRVDAYPHEFSGGMRQRAMIAMGLALEPSVLIADEPTTALDVTIQAQILDLIQDLNRSRGLATILITHDLGVVAEVADRVLVMYGGKVVERGTLDDIFYDPQHPYTWGLLGSLTRLDQPRPHRLPQISGAPPSLLNLPNGCAFRPRCPHEFGKCSRGAGPRRAPARGAEPPRPLLARRPSRSASCARSRGGSGWRRRCERRSAPTGSRAARCSRSPTWSSTSRSRAAC